MKTTVYLTRHGQTEWNLEKRLQGRGDSPLTKVGIQRAEELRDRIVNLDIDCIYSSPIERALNTAKILRGQKALEIISNDGLMEMNFGEYEGKITDDVKIENPQWDIEKIMKGDITLVAPNGETLEEVRYRVRKSMDCILHENKGRTLLVVAHGITLKALMYYFKDNEVNSEVMGQATLTKVVVDKNGNFNIEYKNDDSHFTISERSLGW